MNTTANSKVRITAVGGSHGLDIPVSEWWTQPLRAELSEEEHEALFAGDVVVVALSSVRLDGGADLYRFEVVS